MSTSSRLPRGLRELLNRSLAAARERGAFLGATEDSEREYERLTIDVDHLRQGLERVSQIWAIATLALTVTAGLLALLLPCAARGWALVAVLATVVSAWIYAHVLEDHATVRASANVLTSLEHRTGWVIAKLILEG